MYYPNKYLNKRISILTEAIFNTFNCQDTIKRFIKDDLENGSNMIQELSDKLKEMAEKNKEIHLVYKKTTEKIKNLIEENSEEIKNLIEKNND